MSKKERSIISLWSLLASSGGRGRRGLELTSRSSGGFRP